MQATPEKLSPKTNEWANRLARFEASGQFVAEFCHAEGVSVPNFYRWRKILSEANIAPVQKSEFIELGPLALSPAASELTPESPSIAANTGTLSIRLELGHGLVLHIERR